MTRRYLQMVVSHMTAPRVLSLFSGAGGLDIGFHDAGFDIIKAVEIDKKYSDVMKNNTGDGSYFGSNLEVLNIDVNDLLLNDLDDIDWIIGGPPCQTFSAAGRRANGVRGLHDKRGILFERYVEIVHELQPKGFLYENVYGLVGAEGGEPWLAIKEGFESAGYKLYHRILDSADYGAPQHRERLIMVGLKEGEFKFPRPTNGPDSIGKKRHFSAREAINGLPNQEWDGTEFGGQWGHLLPDIPPGLNYSFYTKKLGHPNPIFAWRSKFSDFLYKADPERPVRTIKAQGGKYTGPLHWANRHFTAEELKLLQSFPKEFKLGNSEQVNRAVIGNSVPPALALVLAEAVMIQIFERENHLGLTWLAEEDALTFRKEKRKRTEYYKEKAIQAHNSKQFSHQFTPEVHDQLRFDIAKSVNLPIVDSGEWLLEVVETPQSLCINVAHVSDRDSFEVELDDPVVMFDLRRHGIIKLKPNGSWDLPLESIEISCYSPHEKSIMVGFKMARCIIKQRFGIDDLIQLNGYYQQSQQYLKIEYEFLGPTLDESWHLADAMAKSEYVGEIVQLSKWCELLSKTPEELFDLFSHMKMQGFDIRDNTSNPNIASSHVLVTYPFPSLTTNKVQWEKKLGGMIEPFVQE